MFRLVTCFVVVLLSSPSLAQSDATELLAKNMVEKGLGYLIKHQGVDGSWSKPAKPEYDVTVGVTALALIGLLESHVKQDEGIIKSILQGLAYLKANVRPSGAVTSRKLDKKYVNYTTALAMMAFQSTGDPQYHGIIKNAQSFLINDKQEKKPGVFNGGIGYGGDDKSDLANTYMAIEALNKSGLDKNSPVFKRAIAFITRCQNNSETNALPWAGNDGGFTYLPGPSRQADGSAKSYGSMTYAGLFSLLFAGVNKSDERIEAAWNWIRKNYTLTENPGKEGRGLYFYYNIFAKSMYAMKADKVTDANGKIHDWRGDLIRSLGKQQGADGAWENSSKDYKEADKNLVTAYSVIALNYTLRK